MHTVGQLSRGDRIAPRTLVSIDGLPAEMLIDSGGRVLAVHYGRYVDDHWSVDDVLALAAEA
jgi:hypothetical protein